MLHCKFYGVAKEKRKDRIQKVLEIVDLSDKLKKTVEKFLVVWSGDWKLLEACCIIPCVLFLDELTVRLDPQTRNHIWDYILRLKEKAGITIFLTTHYMNEADISDCVAVMDHRELIALDTPEALKTNVGGNIIEIETADNDQAEKLIKEEYEKDVKRADQKLTFQVAKGNEFLVSFIKDFPIDILTVNLRVQR